MADVIATSFGVLNYSGMLFNKGNTRTPLSSIIGGKAKTTNHVEFVTGQEYTAGGDGSQPAISETASLTAPDATVVTREQKTNVTQIFQAAVGISYAKQSNMGTLAGINIENQQANPMNELDFQVAAKIQQINRDIEYTFINGVFNKATKDSEANKTRGLVPAITSNVTAMAGKPLGLWDIADMVKKIYGANAPTDGPVSYTHLDLVKSFYLGCLEYLQTPSDYHFYDIFPESKLVQTNADTKILNLLHKSRFPTVMSVSYTHLVAVM